MQFMWNAWPHAGTIRSTSPSSYSSRHTMHLCHFQSDFPLPTSSSCLILTCSSKH
jgi:hypothetical protein